MSLSPNYVVTFTDGSKLTAGMLSPRGDCVEIEMPRRTVTVNTDKIATTEKIESKNDRARKIVVEGGKEYETPFETEGIATELIA